MNIPEGIIRLIRAFLGVTSVLLILDGGQLLFAAWLFATRHQLFWTTFWAAGGFAFVAYGVVSLLDLAKLIPASAMDLMSPVLKLGAVLLAIFGAAWPVMTVIRWRRTGDFEAYGVVIGLIMLAQGVAAFAWLARPRREATP